MKRYTEVAASYGRRHFNLLVAALILLVALALRLWDLGSVPSNLTADELDDLQNAYRVIYGQAGGFFGLDWNQSPNLNMYFKAAAIEVFGDSIAGTRMYSVVLSMAALVALLPAGAPPPRATTRADLALPTGDEPVVPPLLAHALGGDERGPGRCPRCLPG